MYKAALTWFFLTLLACSMVSAQTASVRGKVFAGGKPVAYAVVGLIKTSHGSITDSLGTYRIKNIPASTYSIQVACIGFKTVVKPITLHDGEEVSMNFDLTDLRDTLNEVVISGTLKEVSRAESPVAVEVYSPVFFKKNPTPTIFDALQHVNGVRPQLNCNVCNTGDIHINGLEGPYTMVLIDGMPIVSSLSTVYGLSGIPNSLVERVEIVKGPASSLYGSEAVGGLINIITKNPLNAPLVSVDIFGTSWQEFNTDLGFKFNAGSKASVLTGLNYFNFQNKVDNNSDNFTDMTLQNRLSVFQKWNFDRKQNRVFSLAGRYMYEDRWGGDMRWDKSFRGGDSIYGENIYTSRFELLGDYQLPVSEKVKLSFSFNSHDQNSVYGTTVYKAQQNIAFAQLIWDKQIGHHDFLAGTALRYTFYEDNTPATVDTTTLQSRPQKTWLPGLFVQDEINLTETHKLLLGIRYDYNSYHGSILTPRLAYKWTLNAKNIFRLNAGTGYRVVNIFTEDHAALTGARMIEIKRELNPERSYNVNINYVKKFFFTRGTFIALDASVFYTYYNNRIIADYETDPNKIIYDNLSGYAQSKGVSLNTEFSFVNGLKILAGATLLANTITENGITTQQVLTEKMNGVWAVSYKINRLNLAIDYTGNIYSPMRLPLLGPLDPRAPISPWWSIQNIQVGYHKFKNIELYGGIKNLLNWTPAKNNPFIISRPHDPFDKQVQYDNNGQIIATANNPYALSFDPTYVYAPMQGIRFFVGFRYVL
jgi:outer membrane receptor for ferrienterochelin and colicins